MKILLIFLAFVFFQACKHPLAIEGEGDIIERLVGLRGCSLEESQANSPRCTENEVADEDYNVSYEALARPGWRFFRWAGAFCDPKSISPYCDYNITREWVNLMDENQPGGGFPATVAIFVETPMSTVVVDGKANGGFGPLLGGHLFVPAKKEMVVAAVLLAGETVIIEATGEINIATNSPGGIFTPPEGLDFSGDQRPSPFYYFPLEEAAVDAGGLSVPVPPDVDLYKIGALFGAFIPLRTVHTNNFIARNDDPDPDFENFPGQINEPVPMGAIPSDSLFHIGSGPYSFEAPEDGTLFLGVNDASVSNNAGEYTVSVTID